MKRLKFLSPRRQSVSPFRALWPPTENMMNSRMQKNILVNESSREFLRNTSIHGLRYIGEPNRPLIERIIWVLFVLAGCSFSVYCCYLEWIKWNDSVILITRDPAAVIYKPLKFPEVTICGTNKISANKLMRVLQEPKYANWMNFTIMAELLGYLTKFDSLSSANENFRKLLAFLNHHNNTMEDLEGVIRNVSPSCSEIFIDCQWKSNKVNCSRLFSWRYTDDGICCSIDVDELVHNEEDIRHSLNITHDSSRSINADFGIHSGLRLILDPDPNDTAIHTIPFDGFKVLLHHQQEFPDVTERGFLIGSGQESFVALDNHCVSYTSAIPSVPFEKRQCYLDGERALKYHPHFNYTRSICLHECRMERIIQDCGCLPYFMRENSDIPCCALEAYPCVAKFLGGHHQATMSTCNCPAACRYSWFTSEISSVPFSPIGFPKTQLFKRLLRNKEIDPKDCGRLIGLRIFFKFNAGDSFTMDLPFGNKELFASMGGLLGFGLGFSIISGIEIFYFLCCRCCFRKKMEVKHGFFSKGDQICINPVKYSVKNRRIRVSGNPLFKARNVAWIDTPY